MKHKPGPLRLGIVGCGAIGSRIALSTRKELKSTYMLSAIYDIDAIRARALAARMGAPRLAAASLQALIRRSDVIVEAVNTPATRSIVSLALSSDKDVMAMSVGRLLGAGTLSRLTRRTRGKLILPSGAIAGLDAVKAAALAGIRSITLTSRKPPAGFADNPYVISRKIDLDRLKTDTLLFEGDPGAAVKYFPQNINVAAAVALAAGPGVTFRVRIIASPALKSNTHELVLEGAFGRITTCAQNTVCPDNPKTSYLAVLSGIRTLRDHADHARIGT